MEGAIDRRVGEKMEEITAELADPVAVADFTERSHWTAATWRVDLNPGGAVEAADKPEYS